MVLGVWVVSCFTLASVAGGCTPKPKNDEVRVNKPEGSSKSSSKDIVYATLPELQKGDEVAVFAGGCFWCMESDFESVPGVKAVVSGNIGGHVERPTYRQVSSRGTGHAEAIWVHFDPKKISYSQLLTHFWHHIDPTTADRQFCDVGDEYRPEIFYLNPAQQKEATESKATLETSKPFSEKNIVKITSSSKFYAAEIYHQDFYKKKPGHYQSYRKGCGRNARLKELWGELYNAH
ncbi:MAG: peptide-methionine (S)-S-oxide reductase MsrA [Deltaproteobacteria bacterium]|nr:peptide-methionine (S)-S-oxide reductase MsrA [Deltaproteobacteria bacterium]